MSVDFSEAMIETRRGPRRVLVAQPRQLMTVDGAALDRLRASKSLSEIDRQIVDQLGRGQYHVVLFRGGNGPDQPRYRFSDDFAEAELPAAGKVVVSSMVMLYRELARHGVIVLVGAELSDRELLAFRGGTAGLVYEGESRAGKAPGGTQRFNLDLWLLRHMTLFSRLSLDGVLNHLLPTSVPMLEPRVQRIRSLL